MKMLSGKENGKILPTVVQGESKSLFTDLMD